MEFNSEQLIQYKKYLSAIASLSKLFSVSSTPYLDYRVTELLFCRAFDAKNISRDDIAYDAIVGNIGVGIKTFIINNNATKTEKIAEFNKHSSNLQRLRKDPERLIQELAEYRNKRIHTANTERGVKRAIYHCIGRAQGEIRLFHNDYHSVDINSISGIYLKDNILKFRDKYEAYSFNLSKSTLYKVFQIPAKPLDVIKVKIIDDPFRLLISLLGTEEKNTSTHLRKGIDYVVLPLYSTRLSSGDVKKIAPKSGLNQWNAGGRKRDFGECYISVPQEIHRNYPNFFPARDVKFKLTVPTGDILTAKICQDNSKALMTDPNKELSDWLLRKLLGLKRGEIATYDHLIKSGTDSVVVKKIDKNNFSIYTYSLDGYDKFINDEDIDDIR